jgi:hypothetical protein
MSSRAFSTLFARWSAGTAFTASFASFMIAVKARRFCSEVCDLSP